MTQAAPRTPSLPLRLWTRTRERAKRVPRPLALILALAAIQVVAWSAVTAPLQGPDEPAHFGYAQYIAETGNAPAGPGTEGRGPLSSELGRAMLWADLQPLIGNRAARPAWSEVNERVWEDIKKEKPARDDGFGPNAVGQNPPLYYLYLSVPYHLTVGGDVFDRVFTMRLASGALFLATLVFFWLLAGELFRDRRWVQAASTAIVALHPKLAFLAATVNPDTLLVTFATAFAWLGVRLLRRGPSYGLVGALAGVTVGSALTHGRGLSLVPPALFLLGLAWWRHRPGRRDLAAYAGMWIGAAVVGAVLYLATRAPDAKTYGGEIGEQTGEPFNLRQFFSYVWQFYLPKLGFMADRLGPPYGYRQVYIESFYGTFGALEVGFRNWVNDLLQVLSALGIVSLYTAVVLNFRRLLRSWDVIALLALVFISLVGLLHLSAFRDLQLNDGSDPLLTGRYLLPAIAVWGAAIGYVIYALPRKAGAIVAGVLVALGVLLQLTALGLTAERFYG